MLEIALLFTLNVEGPPDRWFAPDKLQHFLLGGFVQGVGYGLARSAGASHGLSLTAASAGTVVVTVGKEFVDRRGSGTPSMKDLVWGVAGAAAVTPLLERTSR